MEFHALAPPASADFPLGRQSQYNAINGTATCSDQWLNQDVVRKTWNFTGVIETDCGALSGIQVGPEGSDDCVSVTVV